MRVCVCVCVRVCWWRAFRGRKGRKKGRKKKKYKYKRRQQTTGDNGKGRRPSWATVFTPWLTLRGPPECSYGREKGGAFKMFTPRSHSYVHTGALFYFSYFSTRTPNRGLVPRYRGSRARSSLLVAPFVPFFRWRARDGFTAIVAFVRRVCGRP